MTRRLSYRVEERRTLFSSATAMRTMHYSLGVPKPRCLLSHQAVPLVIREYLLLHVFTVLMRVTARYPRARSRLEIS